MGLELKLEIDIFAPRVNRVFSWMLSNAYDLLFWSSPDDHSIISLLLFVLKSGSFITPRISL